MQKQQQASRSPRCKTENRDRIIERERVRERGIEGNVRGARLFASSSRHYLYFLSTSFISFLIIFYSHFSHVLLLLSMRPFTFLRVVFSSIFFSFRLEFLVLCAGLSFRCYLMTFLVLFVGYSNIHLSSREFRRGHDAHAALPAPHPTSGEDVDLSRRMYHHHHLLLVSSVHSFSCISFRAKWSETEIPRNRSGIWLESNVYLVAAGVDSEKWGAMGTILGNRNFKGHQLSR